MEQAIFNTADHPLMRRGEFWLEEVCLPVLGVLGKTHVHRDPGFFGQMTMSTGSDFSASALSCTAGLARRSADEVRERPLGTMVVAIQRGENAIWHQGGEDVVFRRGDIIITNPDRPYQLTMRGNFDLVSFYVSRAMLESALLPSGRDVIRVPGESAAGKLAAGFGSALSNRVATLADNDAREMMGAFCKVASVAAGAMPSEHLASLREARLAQAQRFIRRNLTDPELSPASCARGLGISVRALHLAFVESGESFSSYLQRRRLELCRQILASPGALTRPVADIAFACGFGSLPSFYRAFAAAYGAAPGELRGLPS